MSNEADEKEVKEIDSMYFHVSNSGVTFTVQDSGYGPELQISSSAFGNLKLKYQVRLSPKGLKALGEMLVKSSEEDFSETYCHAGE